MAFEQAFQQAFIYLASAVVAVLLGKRLGLGAVLGYLLVGAAIGPWGFHLIGNEGEQITHFAEFGVLVIFCTLAITGATMAVGIHFKPALAVGLILTMSSTAIVLQTLAEKGLLH